MLADALARAFAWAADPASAAHRLSSVRVRCWRDVARFVQVGASIADPAIQRALWAAWAAGRAFRRGIR